MNKASRNNSLSNYGAGILADGKAARKGGQLLSVLTLVRRISAVICNERATPPTVKRTSQSCSNYYFAMPNRASSLLPGALAVFAIAASVCAAAGSPDTAASTNASPPPAPIAANDVPEAPADALLLRNGDRLFGKLLAIDSQATIRWQHPDAAQPIEFKPETVSQIDFPAQHLPAAPSDTACKIHLGEGGLLQGSLVSCDAESVVLDTWYAGRLTIARNAIQSLSVSSASTTSFDGITTMEGWTQGSAAAAFAGEAGQWTYRNGGFYASKAASIARDLALPDVAEIEFDLAWKGALNLAIALYTDSLQPILLSNKENGPDFGGFYSLRIQSVFMQLMRITKHDPLNQASLGDLVVPSLSQSNRIHMDLRASKPQHSIALFIDGALIKQWIDPAGFAGEGKGVRFVQNPPGGAVRISNLRVSHWDGIFEDTRPADVDPSRDTAWLSDGSVLTGAIESIANGKLTVQTAKEKVEVPLARLREVMFAQHTGKAPANGPVSFRAVPGTGPALNYQWQLAQPGGKSAPENSGNTRASFAQGGIVTFQLDSWSPEGVLAHSSAFGKARFNPAAFVRFQFLETQADSKSPANGVE
jgi:hypothetical protein